VMYSTPVSTSISGSIASNVRSFDHFLFMLTGRRPRFGLLFGDCRREGFRDLGFPSAFGGRPDSRHHPMQMPVIVRHVTVPAVHSASRSYGAVGCVPAGAVPESTS